MMFNYLYHYCGLFTGPYYSFQVLHLKASDSMNQNITINREIHRPIFQMFLDSCDSNASAFHQNYLDKGLVGEYTYVLPSLTTFDIYYQPK